MASVNISGRYETMKAIVKGAVISSAGALLLGTGLALSSAMAVSGATRAHPAIPATSTTCSAKSGYCLTVQNTSTGGALEATAKDAYGVHG
jgi:hypothetical protein